MDLPILKRLPRAPLINRPGILGTPIGAKKEIKIQIDHLEEIEKEIHKIKTGKEKPDVNLIEEKIREIRKNKGNPIEENKIKEPILELITANGERRWYEGVSAGHFKIPRTDNKTAIINLPLSKLTTMKWGNDQVKGWIAYENELIALPNDPEMDSAIAYQNIEEIITNRKNFEAQNIKAWEGLIGMLVLGIVAILVISFVVTPLFAKGKNLPQIILELGEKKKLETQTTTIPTTDQNKPTINQDFQEWKPIMEKMKIGLTTNY